MSKLIPAIVALLMGLSLAFTAQAGSGCSEGQHDDTVAQSTAPSTDASSEDASAEAISEEAMQAQTVESETES